MLGLAELVRRSAPWECPFCGDPRASKPLSQQNGGRPPLTCGDVICKRAYHIYYGRDRRRKPLTREQKDRNNVKRRADYAAQRVH